MKASLTCIVTLGTQGTLCVFLNQFMGLFVAFGYKLFVTVVTLVWLHPSVAPHVSLHTSRFVA